MNYIKLLFTFILLSFLIPISTYSQGVTTSAIKGEVIDSEGETLPGANVVAIHLPTGTTYGTSTNSTGSFNIRNMRVGGPYRVEISFVGFEKFIVEDLNLSLGETFILNTELREAANQLGEIEVIGSGDIFDRNKNGVDVKIDSENIEEQPTVGRSLTDFTRLTPQAYVVNDDDDGPAISIAGQNNRFNSIFIDGAVNNDVFGLSAQGTNGGQTGATPISIDAIEQFQINLSPYDVSQGGFTGGAINAITRSGTNQYEGSFYYFRRGEQLAGETPRLIDLAQGESREKLPEFSNDRVGFRLGGPIIKDKLFFFVNGEILRSDNPQPFGGVYTGGSGIDGLEEIRNTLINEVNYDPGTFGNKNSSLDSDKLLAKIDWNINQNHKLSARYSYTESDNIDAFASDQNTINFSGRNEVFPNTTHTAALEVSSTFGENMANKLILGYTDVLDDRGVNGQFFPTVNIDDTNGGDIFLGNEPFSTSNILDQEIFTITNNFNIFLGQHTLTIGTHNEFYSIANQFIPFNFGWYFYDSVEDFLQSVRAVNDPTIQPANSFFQRGFSLVGDANTVGDDAENIGAFNAYQIGFYIQDEWQVVDNFRLTGGLRFDVPGITTDPRFAPDVFAPGGTLDQLEQFNDLEGAKPGETPDPQLYLSPRLGFNWDLAGNKQTQIRGGLGTFLGRVPFVWPGGMFLNNGANTGIVSNFGPNPFRPNPTNGLTLTDFGRAPDEVIPSGRLEIFAEDFKYPRVFRTSLGIDQRLPLGFVATLEGQFTKNINNIAVENVNLLPPNETLDGPDNRPIFYYLDENGDFSERNGLIDQRYDNIHVVGNTSDGYAFDITTRLQKAFDFGLQMTGSYTYGDSYAVNDGTSSQINSIWRGTENVFTSNNPTVSRSDFSLGHRVLLSMTFKKQYFSNLATTVSLFLEGQSGRPFSYTIDNSDDMISENGIDASLLYIPTTASELTFDGTPAEQAAQVAALERFIESSDYLNSNRGEYADRNGSRAPFETIIDLKIEQEVFANVFNRNQKVEVTLDIFNFTALLGDIFNQDSWGARYDVGNVELIEFERFQDPENGDFTPVYSLNFDPSSTPTEQDFFEDEIQDFGTFGSRWLMQFGVRYTF